MPSMIDPKDFEKIEDFDTKQNITFSYIADIYVLLHKKDEDCRTRKEECNKRFKTLENRKLFDKGISGVFGVVGGYIAMMTKGIFHS